jgi:ribosome-associated protein
MSAYLTPEGRSVPRTAVRLSFARSGGPGGQHANKNETKVEVRIDLSLCPLNDVERTRIVTRWGETIRVVCEEHRSQTRNRAEALNRALKCYDEALVVPVERRATRPGRAAVERRLANKRRCSQRKQERRNRED